MQVDLIACDVDGTLVDETERLIPELIEIVETVRKKGIAFTLSTGRNKEFAQPFLEGLGIHVPAVLTNGASVFRGEECLLRRSMPVMPLMEAIHQAKALGLSVSLADEYSEKALWRTPFVDRHVVNGDRFRQMTDLEALREGNDLYLKVMIMGDDCEAEILRMHEYLTPLRSRYQIISFSDTAIEIAPLHCNKARGLEDLSGIMAIPRERIMACGDYTNDVEMLRWAGIGVAVGNALPQAQEAADYVAEGHYAHGVIEAIKHYCF